MSRVSIHDCILFASTSLEDWKRALNSKSPALHSRTSNSPGCWALNVLIGSKSLVLFESIPQSYLNQESNQAILCGISERDATRLRLRSFTYEVLQTAVFQEANQELRLSEAQVAHFRRSMDDVVRPSFTRAFRARSVPLKHLTLACVRDYETLKRVEAENRLRGSELAPEVMAPMFLPLEQALYDTSLILRHNRRPLARL